MTTEATVDHYARRQPDGGFAAPVRGPRARRARTDADEATLRAMHAAGARDGEIAAALGRDRDLVCVWRLALGLPVNGAAKRPWTDVEALAIIAGRAAGKSIAEIAAELPGRSLRAIRQKAGKLGAQYHRPKPSIDDELRRLWGTRPLNRVARRLGVTAAEAMALASQLGLPGAAARHRVTATATATAAAQTPKRPDRYRSGPPLAAEKPKPPKVVTYDAETVVWARAQAPRRNPEALVILAMLQRGAAKAAGQPGSRA